jgi:hypothetical protein
MNRLRRERLLDELVEAYVDWREACAHVHDAYRFWGTGRPARTGSRSTCIPRHSTRKSGPRGSTPDSSGAPRSYRGARLFRSNRSGGRCGDLTFRDSRRGRWRHDQWVSHPSNSSSVA